MGSLARRRTGRDGFHGPSLQRAHRRLRVGERLGSPPRVPPGCRRDDAAGIHRLHPPHLQELRPLPGRRRDQFQLHGLAAHPRNPRCSDGVYTAFKQQIVWDKGVGGQGAFYRSQHELVFVFKSGKAKHTNNFGLGETGRYRTNVVRYAGANSFRRGRARDLADHTTVKPTALVADFILDCSNPGELIVDPTVGSGTTLLAAHKTGRRGAGIELDPLYVDTALRRLSDATGLTLILVGDGRSFAEISAARRAEQED
ncbi:MAG: DNA-methyltransferase [Novosphingobium sp.]